MPRTRKTDPNMTEADKAAIRNHRTAKRLGKLNPLSVEIAEEREQRLARGRAVIDAAMTAGEKSLAAQGEQRRKADAILLGRAAKIADEQIVELLFENFPISAEQAVERLARFDVNAMRRAVKAK